MTRQNGLDRDTTPLPALKKIAEAASQPSNNKHREKYWKVVAACFEPYGLDLSAKAPEAAKGSPTAIISILKDIKALEGQLTKPSKPGVSLDTLDTDKGLFQSDSCVEFLLLSFCSSFDLRPKQAAGLLAQGNKVLTQIVIKGLKGDFDPVLVWYQSVYQNTERLCDLIQHESDKNSLAFVLNALKAGLDARSTEVVQWCLKTYAKLAMDLEERGLAAQSWGWFISPQSCLLQLLGAITRLGSEIASNGVETMLHFAQFNLVEFFSMHLKNLVQEAGDYYALLALVVPATREMDWAAEALASSRIPQYWVESVCREAEDTESKGRLTALHFFSLLWTSFFLESEESQSVFMSLLTAIKKAFRDPAIPVKATALAILMDLLDTLADLKSAYAPSVYKTLTLLMVEMDPKEPVRELVVGNVKRLMSCTPTIPAQIVVENWCKRIQAEEGGYPLQITDFDLFQTLAKHSRLVLKSAIQLIDVLGKVYLSDVLFSRAALAPFSVLVTRYLDSDAMQEYLLAFLKFGFSQAATNDRVVKERRTRFEKFPSYYTEDARAETLELRRKRDAVFEVTEWLLQLQQDSLNSKIRDLLAAAVMEYRQTAGADCKGFLMLLGTFGEPITALTAYIRTKEQSPANAEMKSRSQFIPSPLEEVQERTLPMLLQDPKHPFPWKRAAQDIEQAKKKARERELKAREEEELARKRLEVKLGKTALALEVRRLEQAVGKHTGELTLYQEGVAVKLLAPPPEISIREFTEQEKEEQMQVSLVLKRYLRLFKVLFERYSGSGFARKHNTTTEIDWLVERKKRLFDTELIGILVDHKAIPKLLTKEETRELMKAYCSKIAHQAEQHWVDFPGFLGIFSQIAYFAYSREPQDLSHLPPAASVKTLVDTFRRETKASKQSTDLYDDPDPGSGDKDVVKELTKLLALNPDTVLPAGYKRVTEQDVSVGFGVPVGLGLSEGWRVALELLDEVTAAALGVHILEPQVHLSTVYMAKGVAKKKERVELPPIQDRPASMLKRKIREYIDDKPKAKPVPTPARLGPALKLAVAQCSEEDQASTREVAELLEDILHSVSLGASRVVVRDAAKVKSFEAEDKPKKREIDPKLREKRKARQDVLSSQLKKDMEARQKKQADKAAVDKGAMEKARAQARQRAILLQQDREARRKQLQEVLAKREEEAQKRKAEEAKAHVVTEEQNRKHHEEMRRKMEEKLKEVLVKKQQEGQAKRPVNAKTSLLDELSEGKKRFERLMQEDKKRLEGLSRKKEELKSFSEAEETQAVLAVQSKQIEHMFGFYCRQSLTKLEHLPDDLFNELKRGDFIKCLNQLEVSPQLVSGEGVVGIFNNLTKDKARKSGVPATLTKEDFKTALVRLAGEAKGRLNGLSGTSSEELKQALGRQSDEDGSLTAHTLHALLVWMDLTLPPKDLDLRLKQLQLQSKPSRKILRFSASFKPSKPGEAETVPSASPPRLPVVDSSGTDDFHLVHRPPQSPPS